MAINNILDLISEGMKETNPIYRQRQQILQQQLFQERQRQTPTAFENWEMERQKGLDKNTEQDRQVKLHEGLTADKGWKEVDKNGNDLEPSAPTTPTTSNPAATGAADAATTGGPSGAAYTAAPGSMGMDLTSEGALIPTAIPGGSPAGSQGTPSGGGPSAPPIASLLGMPQGPLTGGIGGAPAGNTVATTQASRASSAQASPNGQIQQGSPNVSQTGAGQTGSDSGGLPSPAQNAIRKPDIQTSDGRYYRRMTSDEMNDQVIKTARVKAAAARQTALDNVEAVVGDPKNAQLFRDNPNLAATMRVYAQTGQKVPPTTAGALAQALADATQSGDTARADAITKAMQAMRPGRSGGQEADLGGFMHSGLDQNGLDSLADAFNKTGKLPSLGMGNPGLRRAIFQRAADKSPGNDLAMAQAEFGSDQKSLDRLKPGYDAMVAFENTGKKNLQIFMDQAQRLTQKYADVGVPLLNTPLRDIEKLLGQEDIPAYQAARQTAINEIARVTQNPNLVGVLPLGAQKEVANFVPNNATFGQLVEVGKVLTQDMDNRKDAYEHQITAVQDRMRNGTSIGSNTPPPASTPPPATTGGKLPPIPRSLRDKIIADSKGDRNAARNDPRNKGYDTSTVLEGK